MRGRERWSRHGAGSASSWETSSVTSRRNIIADAVGLATLATVGSSAAAAPAGQSVGVRLLSIDIQTFGAAGDGETDDTDAIRAALDEAAAAGGTVLIPRGVYLIDPSRAPLAVASNVTVLGEGPGSILKVKDDVGDYGAVFQAATPTTYVEHVRFRDFRVDQNPSGNTIADINRDIERRQDVIALFNFSDVVVERIAFDPFCGANAVNLNGPETNVARVTGCYFRFERGASTTPFYDTSAIYLDCANHIVDGCIFEAELAARAFGAIETHNRQSTIVNNVSDGFHTGVNISSEHHPAESRDTNDITVAGNTFSRTNNGIALWSLTDVALRGVTIASNTISVAQASHNDDQATGIRMVYDAGPENRGMFRDISIIGNTVVFETEAPEGRVTSIDGERISPLTNYGIGLAPYGDLENILVADNIVTRAPAYGLLLGNEDTENVSSNIRIVDNIIVDAGQNAAMRQAHRTAIGLLGRLADVVVEHNSIIDTGDPVLGVHSIRARPALAERTVLRDNHIGSRTGELVYLVDRNQVRDLVNAVVSGTAAPSSGSWARGDIMYHLEPVAGGNVGWVCVKGGTPGRWSAFGAIEAATEGEVLDG
jgi:Pectate lyase superfamily protein/Right handed beta helix region